MLEERGWLASSTAEGSALVVLYVNGVPEELRTRAAVFLTGRVSVSHEKSGPLATGTLHIKDLSLEQWRKLLTEALVTMLRASFRRAHDGYLHTSIAQRFLRHVLQKHGFRVSQRFLQVLLQQLCAQGLFCVQEERGERWLMPELAALPRPPTDDEKAAGKEKKGEVEELPPPVGWFDLEKSISTRFHVEGKRTRALPAWHPFSDWKVSFTLTPRTELVHTPPKPKAKPRRKGSTSFNLTNRGSRKKASVSKVPVP